MLAQYKTKTYSGKTKKANEMKKKSVEVIPDAMKESSDSSDSDSSSSDDEYEELLLGAMDGYTKVKPEQESVPKPEQKVPDNPKTPTEPAPKPEVVKKPAVKKPKTKKRKKIVVKNYYMNKPQPALEVKNTYDVEKSRRISYIGMGSMPTQTTALRNRIINF